MRKLSCGGKTVRKEEEAGVCRCPARGHGSRVVCGETGEPRQDASWSASWAIRGAMGRQEKGAASF